MNPDLISDSHKIKSSYNGEIGIVSVGAKILKNGKCLNKNVKTSPNGGKGPLIRKRMLTKVKPVNKTADRFSVYSGNKKTVIKIIVIGIIESICPKILSCQ